MSNEGMEKGHGLSGRRPMMQMSISTEVAKMLLELMRRCDPVGLFTGSVQEQFERSVVDFEARMRGVPPPVAGPAICNGGAQAEPPKEVVKEAK